MADKKPQKTRVKLLNLPRGITSKDDLRELCKGYGTITHIEFSPARNHQNASGTVSFKSSADADFAVYRLNGSNGGIKASFAMDGPRRPQQQNNQERQKKPKKPMISLVALTPPNMAVDYVKSVEATQTTEQALYFSSVKKLRGEFVWTNKIIWSGDPTQTFPDPAPRRVHPQEHFTASFWKRTLLALIPDLLPIVYSYYTRVRPAFKKNYSCMKVLDNEGITPYGFAFDGFNDAWVCDWPSKLRHFAKDGPKPIPNVSEPQEQDLFGGPTSLAFDFDGNAYVPEALLHRIRVITPDGHTKFVWGEYGNDDGQFDRPSDVAIDENNGNVAVLDGGNMRVQIFTAKGEFIRKFGTKEAGDPSKLWSPHGIAFDLLSNVYVGDSGYPRIQVFSPYGKPLRVIGDSTTLPEEGRVKEPRSIVIDTYGNIGVADVWNKISIFSNKGELMHVFRNSDKKDWSRLMGGILTSPSGLGVDKDGNIGFTTDEGVYIIQ